MKHHISNFFKYVNAGGYTNELDEGIVKIYYNI